MLIIDSLWFSEVGKGIKHGVNILYLAFGDSDRFKIFGHNSSFRCIIGQYGATSMVPLVWCHVYEE